MMKSPTTNGLSSTIESEASRSPSTFCTASATATPAMPRPVISPPTSTWKFASAMSSTITPSTSRTTMPMARMVVMLAASAVARAAVIRSR